MGRGSTSSRSPQGQALSIPPPKKPGTPPAAPSPCGAPCSPAPSPDNSMAISILSTFCTKTLPRPGCAGDRCVAGNQRAASGRINGARLPEVPWHCVIIVPDTLCSQAAEPQSHARLLLLKNHPDFSAQAFLLLGQRTSLLSVILTHS
uniref:Uncharacterized protein n=1 Tax=Anser brachyrhynchus TaxID=132585 RepID=A0A8B9BAH2_9AVES